MLLSFLLCFGAARIIVDRMNSTGELCGEVICHTMCKRSYNETNLSNLISEECSSPSEELFCLLPPLGLYICISICMLPMIIFILTSCFICPTVSQFICCDFFYSFSIHVALSPLVSLLICINVPDPPVMYLGVLVFWFLIYLFFRVSYYGTCRHQLCCCSRNVTVNDIQMKYITSYAVFDKQRSFVPEDLDCCCYSPIREEFTYDQVPASELKEMIKEVISVPPKPTIASFYYRFNPNKDDCDVKVHQVQELQYQSWQPEIIGKIDKLDGKNMYCKLTVYIEYDNDMDEIISATRREMIRALPPHPDWEHLNTHAQIIDSSGPPNVIGQSSKALVILHKCGMRVLWEFLNIFGFQLILDLIWNYYLQDNRHEITVKKHVYNSNKGRTKAGERDKIIGDRFEQIQATIEKSEDMYSPLL